MGNTVVILPSCRQRYWEIFPNQRNNLLEVAPHLYLSQGTLYHQPYLAVYHTVPNNQSIPALPCSLVNGRAIRIRCSIHSPIQVTGEQIKFQGGSRKMGISTLPYAALRYLPGLCVCRSVPHQWHCPWTCCE